MGMMVECLKHEGTLRSSSKLLKIIVKMVASWSAQDYRQTGVTQSGPGAFSFSAFLFFRFFRVEERGVAGGVNGCVQKKHLHLLVW